MKFVTRIILKMLFKVLLTSILSDITSLKTLTRFSSEERKDIKC